MLRICFGVLRNVTFARTSSRGTSDLVSSIYCRSFDKGDLVAASAADSLHTWSNDGELQHAWNFDLPQPKAHMSRLTFGEIMFRTVIAAGVIALPLVTAAPALAGPGTVSCSFPCTIVGETLNNYAGLPAATVGGPNGYAAFIPNTIGNYGDFLPTTATAYGDFALPWILFQDSHTYNILWYQVLSQQLGSGEYYWLAVY